MSWKLNFSVFSNDVQLDYNICFSDIYLIYVCFNNVNLNFNVWLINVNQHFNIIESCSICLK